MICPSCNYRASPGDMSCGLCGFVFAKEGPRRPGPGGRSALDAPSPEAPAEKTAARPPRRSRHFLVWPPNRPIELKPGEEIVVGRDKKNAMPIPSNVISRRHAVFRWEGDGPVVEDLRSVNGTFLNDDPAPVGTVALKNGDRIKVGTYIIEYRVTTEEGADLSFSEEESRQYESTMALNLEAVADFRPYHAGDLKTTDPVFLVKAVHLAGETGVIALAGPWGQASISFAAGDPVGVTFNHKAGLDALRDIFSQKEGTFRFERREPDRRNIPLTWEQFIKVVARYAPV